MKADGYILLVEAIAFAVMAGTVVIGLSLVLAELAGLADILAGVLP